MADTETPTHGMAEKRALLLDDPSREDAFDGKGHERTASALTSAIRDLGEGDGAIGLEGEFGAGKSTVICLAEDGLSRDNGSTQHRIRQEPQNRSGRLRDPAALAPRPRPCRRVVRPQPPAGKDLLPEVLERIGSAKRLHHPPH